MNIQQLSNMDLPAMWIAAREAHPSNGVNANTSFWSALQHFAGLVREASLCEAPPEPRCQCRVRTAAACPGAWEKGCDLGANPDYVAAVEAPPLVEAMRSPNLMPHEQIVKALAPAHDEALREATKSVRAVLGPGHDYQFAVRKLLDFAEKAIKEGRA